LFANNRLNANSIALKLNANIIKNTSINYFFDRKKYENLVEMLCLLSTEAPLANPSSAMKMIF
jgi:hypothetical protein